VSSLSDPAYDAYNVLPSDTDILPWTTTAIYVGVAGDVTVTMASGNKVLFTAMPIGWHYIRVRRIWATGTHATNITVVKQAFSG
jgi:hypothetical protein